MKIARIFSFRRRLVIAGCILLLGIYFISVYFPSPPESKCEDLSEDSIIFAPAFLNLGTENGVFIKDTANGRIADKIKECAKFIESKDSMKPKLIVLTQKAVSDALNDNKPGLDDGDEIDGIRVFQMHLHTDSMEVRTMAAFRCALERFKDKPPKQIILIAHPKHLNRALYDLKALYKFQFKSVPNIRIVHLGKALYPEGISPFKWAGKNLLGWFGDRILVKSLYHPKFVKIFIIRSLLTKFDITSECPKCVQLPKLVKTGGEWAVETE